MYLTRGGSINLPSGALKLAVLTSFYWLNTAYSTNLLTYAVDAGGSNIVPTHNYARYLGFTVHRRIGNV